MNYQFGQIERKWQERWEQDPYFSVRKNLQKPKYYCLDMFPYPSASGLHLGHWKGYVFSDVYSRIKLLQGFNVLHPMGWDAFGLPAENAAIKEKIHPATLTKRNVAYFKKQLKAIGAIFDWSCEVDTTDPDYYKWTQWIFLQMFKAGLAYQQNIPVNWCPQCLTGLANEEAAGGVCDRCGTVVEQKPLRQWVLKITHYAERLDRDLADLDWPEKVKLMQRHWIGKSIGANVMFKTASGNLNVYTTRPDTIFGASCVVIAPEHEMLQALIKPEQQAQVTEYLQKIQHMTAMERQLDKEKHGAFTGGFAVNPATGKEIPVYVSSFVLKNYGTGAIMCVPAHDQRDFEFAKKYDLPIQQVIVAEGTQPDAQLSAAYTENGTLVNSGQFDGLNAFDKGKEAIVAWLEKQELATVQVQYRLRDWVFSRQRYWGEPIPLIHCKSCGVVPVPEKDLPVRLPNVEKYEPTGTGESPLADIDFWVNVACPQCQQPAKRETNTMPQWAGSCWYFLRFADSQNKDEVFSQEAINKWLPVDFYVGGIEHAVLHLLYARFYVKFLQDIGAVSFGEPFKKLFNQGMICMRSEKSGRVEKMSKSKGNVVSPDSVVAEYGTDALRLYILFMGSPEMDCEWSQAAVTGVFSYLQRLWHYLAEAQNVLPAGQTASEDVYRKFHQFLKEYQHRLSIFKPNTAVAAMMEFLNDLMNSQSKLDVVIVEQFLASISIMVPHFASELLEVLCNKQLQDVSWPECDAALAKQNSVVIPVQVNGKLRTTVTVDAGSAKEVVEMAAKTAAEKWLKDKKIIKTIFVLDKLTNFVVQE